jgi:hypothetical protein
LPGGHLATNEQPEALAALIAKFERGLVSLPEPRSTISARRSGALGSNGGPIPSLAPSFSPTRAVKKLSF